MLILVLGPVLLKALLVSVFSVEDVLVIIVVRSGDVDDADRDSVLASSRWDHRSEGGGRQWKKQYSMQLEAFELEALRSELGQGDRCTHEGSELTLLFGECEEELIMKTNRSKRDDIEHGHVLSDLLLENKELGDEDHVCNSEFWMPRVEIL
ncbi:hypothetical protein F5879DRAFT_919758 [Lentinula edodes]|nr:hypothetical protein F5879DRAFT_919758 [Lentinula edodes]